jgi:hypothetical protein
MTLSGSSSDRIISIYLTLSQYPLLATRIRELMRQRLVERGVIDPLSFTQEVNQRAARTQEFEGLSDPLNQESADAWEYRRAFILDQLTDQYFAYNLPYEELSELVDKVLKERGIEGHESLEVFNSETAPLELLFKQGMTMEKLSDEEREPYEPRLLEIKVVLIRKMISDQLRYINIAKEWFTISDLAEIRRHKLGQGRIGGKAAGMLLASRILKEKTSPALRDALRQPVSFYVGSDLFYTFMSVNNLLHWNDQKYKNDEQMRADYPKLVKEFEEGAFPPSVLQYMETMLSMAAWRPMIVRSSSLLEDNFGTAFAGKYDSIFLPNQGKPEDNLRALNNAMARIYASTLNPAAIQYRKSRGLLDYDERMALLIQVVEGQTDGRYYFPQLAGVGFSHNSYRWSPQIKASDGFLRLVWGMGTRAVDRVGNDYPRLVALSHPTLNPSSSAHMIRRYSQQYIDLIDMEANAFVTKPVSSVFNSQTPGLRFIAQLGSDGYIRSLRSTLIDGSPRDLVITFEELMKQTNFPQLMQEALQTLEREYAAPVDIEFTAHIREHESGPKMEITLIQCRPLSMLVSGANSLPTNVPAKDKIFSASSLVSAGKISNIRYVVYVPAKAYFAIKDAQERYKLARAIGKLNGALQGEAYIAIGPGRWGTSNPDLGVHIDYADIFNAKALIEYSGAGVVDTEPSLGTHFFQDLLEGQIYPLAIDSTKDFLNQDFFETTPNRVCEYLGEDEELEKYLKLIRVADFRPGYHIQLVMDDSNSLGLGFLKAD